MSTISNVMDRPALKASSAVRSLAGAVGFALLTALAARIRIPLPFTPVPVTLQSLVVLLSGFALGPGFGALSQAVYAGLGALGLPFWAGGAAGPAYLSGPTAGYVAGFVVSAALVGFIARRYRGVAAYLWATVAGYAAIYGCGTFWLAVSLNVGPAEAVTLGVIPFLAGDAVKAILFVAAAAWGRKRKGSAA